MSSRTTFNAVQTPEVLTFESSLETSERQAFIPNSAPYLDSSHQREVQDDSGRPVAADICAWFSKKKSQLGFVTRRAVDEVQNNAGLLLVAASQAFFSMMNVAVKKLNGLDPPVPAFELVIVRMAITYICCMIYMFIMKVPDPFLGPKGIRLWLLFRGFSGFFGLFGLYYSLQYLSLSDATVLTFLSPFTTAIAGALILKESFTKKQALAGLLSLFGVVLIARPGFIFGGGQEPDSASEGPTSAERLGAVGFALLGVVGSTGAYISLRSIGKRAHTLHALVSFCMQCVIISTIGMIVMKVPVVLPNKIEWLFLLLLIGIFGFIAQVLLTLGLQRETAGRGTMAIYIQIVFATILEFLFFQTIPSFLSVLGTVIIMGAAIYVALTKEKDQKNQTVIALGHTGELALEEGLLENPEDESGGYEGDRLPQTSDAKVPNPLAEEAQTEPTKPADATRPQNPVIVS